MPWLDFECTKCKKVFDEITTRQIETTECPECGSKAKRIFPQTPPNFELKYNPKKDICDWSGNTTQYYSEYNKMKSEGKNPRIPALDGDG